MSAQPLADFLLARFDEDEAAARELLENGVEWVEEASGYGANFHRVIADCVAKRRVVAIARRMVNDTAARQPVPASGRGILESLALPYADHPDFRPDWWIDDSVPPGQYGPTADYGES